MYFVLHSIEFYLLLLAVRLVFPVLLLCCAREIPMVRVIRPHKNNNNNIFMSDYSKVMDIDEAINGSL